MPDEPGEVAASEVAAREVLALVTAAALDAAPLEAFVLSHENGALVSFRGVIRNHDHGAAVTGLDYSAHPDAQRILAESCAAVASRHGLRVAAAHRVGELEIGDTALIAAVAAPHRAEAFAACDDLVETIKATVPIWKRQHLVGGEAEWVGL